MFNAFPMELSSDVSIVLSFRIYYVDEYTAFSALTFEQQMIYHCIFSRSCNGFVREKHIKAILEGTYPEWVLPYILKVSDEYVIKHPILFNL